MTVIKTIVAATLLSGCFAGVARAQAQEKQLTPMQLEDQEKRKDADSIDKQYKTTLQRTRRSTAAAPVDDPWSNMRGTPETKPKR
jgi:predicted kinase